MSGRPRAIVVGGLHTDIFFQNSRELVAADRATIADTIRIAGGGKSVNIARMMATLLPSETVAMVGRTTHDPFGLWKPPLDSLEEASVITRYIKVSPFQGMFPGIAILQVDTNGNNASCLCQGIDNEFLEEDITSLEKLFVRVGKNKGLYITSLEAPLQTVIAGKNMASKYGLKIMVEPGGLSNVRQVKEKLLGQDIFLLKPNEHEAEMLSGVPIRSFQSARKAADILLALGVGHILITAGKKGAYFFSGQVAKHIPIPVIHTQSQEVDSTGCGDQVLGTLGALLLQGKSLERAVEQSIYAATLQFYKKGVQPITSAELSSLA